MKHTSEKPYQCTKCGKGFNRKGHLTVHLRQHTDNPLKCTDCGEILQNQRLLKIHLMTHDGIEIPQCPICLKTFISNKGLNRHQCRQTDNRYKCTECTMDFQDEDQLNCHRLTHKLAPPDTERKYECNDCGKCFRRPGLSHMVSTKSRCVADFKSPWKICKVFDVL